MNVCADASAGWLPECGDVASPRPREVGGACRIQVLASARTPETVGGPNAAKRSEFPAPGSLQAAKRRHYITCPYNLKKPQIANAAVWGFDISKVKCQRGSKGSSGGCSD